MQHPTPEPEAHAAPLADSLPREPYISVRFPVHGRTLTADHGYALHAAITTLLPSLHSAQGFAVELISGIPWREGTIALPTRGGNLYLRIPADRDHYAAILPLAGQRLDIAGHRITLGIPSARPLTPATSLYARMVTIKNSHDPEPFIAAAEHKLATLGITATLELPRDNQDRPRRRILTIKRARIVGFSLAAHNLSDDDSLRLQSHGIGGRRAMGCGIFNPIKRLTAATDRLTES